MQKQSDPEKIQFWNHHLEAMKSYTGSAAAYCREHGIPYHNIKYWQGRLSAVSYQTHLPIKASAFAAVEVTSSPLAERGSSLPDAKWLAELIVEIYARCR